MTPILVIWIPPRKQMMQVILAQPLTALPVQYDTIDHIIPITLSIATSTQILVIIFKGLILRLVTPS